MSTVIKSTQLSKVYNLYNAPVDRLKEALNPFGKKYHREFYALNHVNIDIKRGECVGLIGMNGSGKSTLLQIIAGVVTPTSGTMSVNGRISALLELGAGFNPDFTGMDNIRFQCALMEIPQEEHEEVIRQVCAFAEIGDFVHQPVRSYSSGMYVRLAFAVAINVNPDILIVDEALAVGDIYFQTKCLAKIREFREEGKTMLFVSHDAGAVKSLCDRAYLLHRGKVEDEGAPDQVFNHYNNLISLNNPNHSASAESLRKRSGNGKILIQSVRMKNESGIYTDTFTTAEKTTLEIEIESFADVQSPTVGISIRDRLGNEMYGINNFLLGVDFGMLESGSRATIRYEIPLRLGKNAYNIAVSAHTSDNHLGECFDWLNDACIFAIIPSPEHKFVGSTLLDARVSIAGNPR